MSSCLNCGKDTHNKKFCCPGCSSTFNNIKRHKIKNFGASKNTYARILYSCICCKRILSVNNLVRHKCERTKPIRSIKTDIKTLYRYNARFTFGISTYSEWFTDASELINSYGWYSPKKNTTGISRDHLYSISDGFRHSIDPKILSHPANCKLVPHKENQAKKHHSSITIDELLDRIKQFEKLYGLQYQI